MYWAQSIRKALGPSTATCGRPTTTLSRTYERTAQQIHGKRRLLYSSFPSVFLLGRGLQQVGSVPKAARLHLLHDNDAASYLVHLLFDQLQCHAKTNLINAVWRSVCTILSGVTFFSPWHTGEHSWSCQMWGIIY